MCAISSLTSTFAISSPDKFLSQIAANCRYHQMPKSKKTAKWGFSTPEDDRINRSRQILTRKSALWVSYIHTPDLALIGKRGRYRSPPKVKICQKLWFSAIGSQHNEHIEHEIWRVSLLLLLPCLSPSFPPSTRPLYLPFPLFLRAVADPGICGPGGRLPHY